MWHFFASERFLTGVLEFTILDRSSIQLLRRTNLTIIYTYILYPINPHTITDDPLFKQAHGGTGEM